jgi:hypothetical protein
MLLIDPRRRHAGRPGGYRRALLVSAHSETAGASAHDARRDMEAGAAWLGRVLPKSPQDQASRPSREVRPLSSESGSQRRSLAGAGLSICKRFGDYRSWVASGHLAVALQTTAPRG